MGLDELIFGRVLGQFFAWVSLSIGLKMKYLIRSTFATRKCQHTKKIIPPFL